MEYGRGGEELEEGVKGKRGEENGGRREK